MLWLLFEYIFEFERSKLFPVDPRSPESGPAAVQVEDLRRVEHLLEPPQESVPAPVARLGVDEDDDGGAGQRHVHRPAVADILEDLH